VNKGVATTERRAKRLWLAEIAYNCLCGYALDGREVARLSGEKTEFGALCGIDTRHVTTDEAGGTCKEDLHLEGGRITEFASEM
jgi:hypothetical protein